MTENTSTQSTAKSGNGSVASSVLASEAVKATRKRSKESELKLRMRAISRELTAIEKQVAEFETMKKEMAGTDKQKAKLTSELSSIKGDLIKELGLA